MKTVNALARLSDLRTAAFTTNDAAAALGIGRAHASQTLGRLATARQIVRLRRGLWAFADKVSPLLLPVYLTAPSPCYLSLQSALYFHGMVSQMPQRHYVVSLGRSRLIRTPLGAVSLHHVAQSWLTGFDVDARTGVPMATPAKALADFLYLTPARSRLFAALPEIELHKGFKWSEVRSFARRIAAPRRRAMVEKRLRALMSQYS